MAPTHDPLTDKQLEILQREPFELSIGQLSASGESADVAYLMKLGLLSSEQTHISATAGNNRRRYWRSDKPLP
ncbi:hypothetical protein ACFPIF_19475 [Brevundimonas faecalis]|uniref:hypothetical protein n=1 Tax=Brevundimonas faecalis TaxID=947378 RepID=UPI00361444F3